MKICEKFTHLMNKEKKKFCEKQLQSLFLLLVRFQTGGFSDDEFPTTTEKKQKHFPMINFTGNSITSANVARRNWKDQLLDEFVARKNRHDNNGVRHVLLCWQGCYKVLRPFPRRLRENQQIKIFTKLSSVAQHFSFFILIKPRGD